MTERSEYVLETLRKGAEFTLYRGQQHGNPFPVLALALAAEQRQQRLEQAKADAVQQLSPDQPGRIIGDGKQNAAHGQRRRGGQHQRLAPPGVAETSSAIAIITSCAVTMHADISAVSAPGLASASFCPTNASIGVLAKWNSAVAAASTSRDLRSSSTRQLDGLWSAAGRSIGSVRPRARA